MPIKKITDNRWRFYIHVAYHESKENVFKFIKQNMKDESHSIKSIKDLCEEAGGFCYKLDHQNIIIGFFELNAAGKASARLIVHECLHAIGEILRERGVEHTKDTEEVYAYQLEWLCDEVFNICYQVENKLKVKKKNAKI